MYLKDWYSIYDIFFGVYAVSGLVYDSPKFKDGKHIHTSRIKDLEFKDGKLYAHTLNSVYELKNIYAYADRELLRAMLEFYNLVNIWDYLYEEMQKNIAEKYDFLSGKATTPESKLLVEYGRYFSPYNVDEDKRQLSLLSDMAAEIPDNTLMIAADSDYNIMEYAVYKNFNSELVIVSPMIHQGMLQDSVLLSALCGSNLMRSIYAEYEDSCGADISLENERLSFQLPQIIARFFPMGDFMEFYHPIFETDNEYTPRIVVLNRREESIKVEFTNSSEVYICESGETVTSYEV